MKIKRSQIIKMVAGKLTVKKYFKKRMLQPESTAEHIDMLDIYEEQEEVAVKILLNFFKELGVKGLKFKSKQALPKKTLPFDSIIGKLTDIINKALVKAFRKDFDAWEDYNANGGSKKKLMDNASNKTEKAVNKYLAELKKKYGSKKKVNEINESLKKK